MIIGISGKMGSGKDTVGNIIQALMNGQKPEDIVYKLEKTGECYVNPHETEWETKKYAAKLKQIVSLITGATMKELEDQEFKHTPMGKQWQTGWRERMNQPMTPRLMLQLIGTEGGRDLIHPNIWVLALMADYKEDSKWIVTDMRFPNEMDAVKSAKGITIRVTRGDGNTGTHASETALDNGRFDYEIDNNASYEILVKQVVDILNNEELWKSSETKKETKVTN